MADLSRIGERDRLKAKAGDEPHWQRLRQGCYLGFRPSKRGGKGTWFARAYDLDSGKYQRKALGDYGSLAGHDVFTQAKQDAESWAETVESGGVRARELVTVADACEAYLAEKPGSIAEGVFRRNVYPDAIAKVKLDKLRRHHLRAWRKRLEDTPARLTRTKTGKQRTKVRSKSTVNRDMVPLRAALGQVLKPGAPNTDAAWQEALRPFKGADKRRDLYLDKIERKRLLDACEADAASFVHALCLLPLRPGALASLRVSDFDHRTRSLTIGKDKNGQPRQISVPQSIAEFLKAQVEGKLPAAPIFARHDGSAWNKDAWKHPIKDAVHSAKLPGAVAAYTLRHSVITDLIRLGLPALTVAQLSGTSVAMIERHYGHLGRHDAEQALARLAL
ncbi:MAG TPA: tyrosine-type recombinase/integrase [Sphingomicrobium sp.]|nr:tyrosine-type recombinase/integrase [Sphingomicrobium sp.]